MGAKKKSEPATNITAEATQTARFIDMCRETDEIYRFSLLACGGWDSLMHMWRHGSRC